MRTTNKGCCTLPILELLGAALRAAVDGAAWGRAAMEGAALGAAALGTEEVGICWGGARGASTG